MGLSFASLAGEKDFLRFMIICVASLAIRYCINLFYYLVLNIQVALATFNFMGKDMVGMHEISIIVFVQPVGFPVTFVTIFSRHFSIPDDCLTVAFITFKSYIKDTRVIVYRSLF